MARHLLLPSIILLLCFGNAQAKTAATASRLVQQFNGQGDGTGGIAALDSTVFTYSAGRSADDTKSAYLNCDSAFVYKWTPSFYLGTILTNHFNSLGQIDTVVTHTRPNAGGAMNPASRTIFTYTPAGKYNITVSQNWDVTNMAWVNDLKTEYYYNAAGDNLITLEFLWDVSSGTWQGPGRTTYSYNSAGKLTGKLLEGYDASSSTWIPFSRYTYGWDAMGNQTDSSKEQWLSTQWGIQWRYNSFYLSNTLVARSYYVGVFSGTGFVLQPLDSMRISSAGTAPKTETITSYKWNGSLWRTFDRTTSNTDSNGNLVTTLTEAWDPSNASWQNSRRTFSFYNSFNQVVRKYSETWMAGAWGVAANSDYESRYYYEAISTGIAVTPTICNWVGVIMSPVPANNSLALAISFIRQEDFTVRITDVTGKTVVQWNGNSAGAYTRDIDTRAYSAGTYFLNVYSSSGRAARAFVVQH